VRTGRSRARLANVPTSTCLRGSLSMSRVPLVGATLLVAALGIEQRRSGGPILIALDREANVPAFWSGFLLVAATAAALTTARDDRRGARWPWWALAVLLLAMAGDEVFGLHESLERQTGIDWQLLYLPVMAAGAAAAIAALARLREHPRLAAGFLVSCGAWGLAQVLEALQWDGARKVSGYGELMALEEILEMAGSIGFTLTLFAAGAWLRSRAHTRRSEIAAPMTTGDAPGSADRVRSAHR
jgi:hypothetical protein